LKWGEKEAENEKRHARKAVFHPPPSRGPQTNEGLTSKEIKGLVNTPCRHPQKKQGAFFRFTLPRESKSDKKREAFHTGTPPGGKRGPKEANC